METNRLLNRWLSIFGMAALLITMSCKEGRETARGDIQISNEAQSGTQTAELLDKSIKEFNQEMASVERSVMSSESVSEEGFREGWREIEVKRHELNNKIENYNKAVEKDATLEASEIRNAINSLLGELQNDLKEFKEEYGGSESNQQQMPEHQNQPFQKENE